MGSLVMANAFQDKLRKKIEENKTDKDESGEDEDEEDETEEVTMMPMADMLNHKTGFNNVCCN
jgi:N-lysine methyltransferase SETD6